MDNIWHAYERSRPATQVPRLTNFEDVWQRERFPDSSLLTRTSFGHRARDTDMELVRNSLVGATTTALQNFGVALPTLWGLLTSLVDP